MIDAAATEGEEDEFGEFVATSKAEELTFQGFNSTDPAEKIAEMRQFLGKVFQITQQKQQPLPNKDWAQIQQDAEDWFCQIADKLE